MEIRNSGDQLVYQTEKTLGEFKDKLPGDVTADIEGKVKSLKEALEANDYDRIEKETQELLQASQKMGEVLYKATAGGEAGAPGATPPR